MHWNYGKFWISPATTSKLIVGEVVFIELDDDQLESDGGIDLEQADTLASKALDTYFTISKYRQLPYAKP